MLAAAFRITIFDSTVCQASNLALVSLCEGLVSFCQIPRLVLCFAAAFRITIFDSTVCQAWNLALVVCARGLFSFCQIPRLVLCLRRVYTKFDSI